MGIRSSFDGDYQSVNLSGMADEMLADIVADHAADRFARANAANRAVAGDHVPYTVRVNNRVVHHGRGSLFPQGRVEMAIERAPAVMERRNPVVDIEWMWQGLTGGALTRAVENYIRIERALDTVQDAAAFARLVLGGEADSGALFRYLLTRYAHHNYPQLFRRLDQARALYRVYRLLQIAGGIGGGAVDARSEEGDVLRWIARELVARSPILSGNYKAAHVLMSRGEILASAESVAGGGFEVVEDVYTFMNPLPYARRIEVGKTKEGRDFVLQVSPRIYERVAADAQAKFVDIAEITFGYAFSNSPYEATGGMQARTPRYKTGEVRKATQTHWVASTYNPKTGGLTPAQWVTYRAGEPKTRIRRGGAGPVKSPVIDVRFF